MREQTKYYRLGIEQGPKKDIEELLVMAAIELDGCDDPSVVVRQVWRWDGNLVKVEEKSLTMNRILAALLFGDATEISKEAFIEARIALIQNPV